MLRAVETVPESFDVEGVAALAVTSGRVARLLSSHRQLPALAALPVFAVGDRSAESMRKAGFQRVTSVNGDVAALAHEIVNQKLDGRVLYLAAQDRAGNLEGMLEQSGVSCKVSVLYRMEPIRSLDDSVLRSLRAGEIDGVLIYSRRTADAFVAAVTELDAAELFPCLRVIAISGRSAEPFPENTCMEIAVHPTEEALLERALRQC